MGFRKTCVAFIGLLLAMPCRAVVITEVVAHPGMQVPGQAPGVFFLDFGGLGFAPPVINASGEVALFARIDDSAGSLFLNGIWTGTPDALSNVVLEDAQPPGIADPSVGFFSIGRRFILDRNGHVAFGAVVDDDGFNKGIWAQGDSGTRLVVLEGMDAPNTPAGYVFTGLGNTQNFLATYAGADYVFGGGRVAFFANDVHDGVSADRLRGIWSERPSAFSRSLQVVARTGPDTDFIPSEVPTINGFGQTVFQTTIDTGSETYNAIWSETSGTLAQVVSSDSGAGGDSSFQSFGTFPGLNDNGIAAFTASFSDLDPENDTGIWKQAPLVSGLIVNEGTSAPGTPDVNIDGVPDHLFGQFVAVQPLVNQAGHVVFKATANNPGGTDPREGIWTDRSGGLDQLEPIALTDTQPPGLPAGSVYTSFIPPFQSDNVAINARSHVAFLAQFQEAGGASGTGLWAEAGRGRLFLVVRTGDTLDLPDGTTLTVTAIDFAGGSGNQDGRPSGFSDNGQVVYRARGSDGIFVATIVDPIFVDGFE